MSGAEANRPDPANRELTIVLTLRDRSAFTLRWMEYANSIALPFRVLIADGGLDDSAQAMLAEKALFPNVDYEYVRYPADRGYIDYYAKMADALGRVSTPYVAMADNDDFFVVRTMQKAVHFLSAHSDYVSCGGQGAIFWAGSTNPPAPGGRVYGTGLHWKSTREVRSIDADSASQRLRIVSVSKSDTFYYDVKRVAAARRHFEIVRDLNLRDLFLVEHLVWYLAAIAGKTKRLETLYLVRQQDSPGSSGGTHAAQFGDWFGRMLVPSWSEDFERFLEVVSLALSLADGISVEEARCRAVRSYRASVAPSLLSDLMDEPTVNGSMPSVVWAVRRLVKLPEDSALRRIARTLYRRLKWVSLDAVYGTELLARQVPEAELDFEPIRDFLERSE